MKTIYMLFYLLKKKTTPNTYDSLNKKIEMMKDVWKKRKQSANVNHMTFLELTTIFI